MAVVSGAQGTNYQDRTNICSVLDVLNCGISSIVSLEVSFPSFDFCAKGDDVHDRRGQRSPV